jgi:hypothetical protein
MTPLVPSPLPVEIVIPVYNERRDSARRHDTRQHDLRVVPRDDGQPSVAHRTQAIG